MERIARLRASTLLSAGSHSSLLASLLARRDDPFDRDVVPDLPLAAAPQLPVITRFEPVSGHAGTAMIIEGRNFANDRADNRVMVGGRPAHVVESAPKQLLVITHHETRTGPVVVTVDGHVGEGMRDFEVRGWPKPDLREDGPPFSFEGLGPAPGPAPSAGTVPATGTARILVVNCFPTDLVPPDLAAARQDVVDTFADVTTFYDQASYGQLDVLVDVTDYVALLDDAAHYHRENGAVGYPNIDFAVMDQLMAECARGAQNQGLDLDNYAVMVAAVYLPGLEVRAWGGFSRQNFAYDDGGGTSISITADHALGLIAQRHDADWGRAAHEFAHNVLDPGLVLGEDVYGSDLIDPSEATASKFEMMGNHDSHPLFSGHFMHQLGWYSSGKILDLEWDRNPFSDTYEIVAHGLSEDGDAGRHHLIRIKIASGLYYFVEVRQRPGSTAQVFDENIPLPLAGSPDGGVVVTKVVTGELNNNHQTRLITLLQDEQRVLTAGEVVEDPLRSLRIEVVDDDVVTRPRVCRVQIAWAQTIADDPEGQFDLRIEPWGPGYETEDIWIDRMPFGTYDFTDPSGNPTGNGDEPRPLEVNRYYARIHNAGAVDATNVKVTHYAISPPGVGDNGTWTPLDSYEHALVPRNGSVQRSIDWVPLVGEHTCLKVAISQQLGEVAGGNNQAQENVFNFQPPAASVPAPVKLTVAVRNPLPEPSPVLIHLENVPRGYRVYFPHRWVWLTGHGERKLDLLVVPTIDFQEMQSWPARVRLFGRVPRGYSEKLEITQVPGSWLTPIGGVIANVEPKRRGEIHLDGDVERIGRDVVRICGRVSPAIADQAVRVVMVAPGGEVVAVIARTDRHGRFCADFDLERARRGEGQRRTDQRGCYEFEAQIFNASQMAPTASKPVCVQLDR